MHIHEILNMKIEDYEVERRRLEVLFTEKLVRYSSNYTMTHGLPMTLMGYLAEDFIHSYIRGTATDIQNFFTSLSPHWRTPSLEGLLLYCEILLNILTEFNDRISRHQDAKSLSGQIRDNIVIVLNKTGHRIGKNKDCIIEILQNNSLAAEVVEDLADADTARAVLEYTHYGLKGNLEKKRELLRKISHHVEPIMQDDDMKGTYGWLTKDLGCCLNSLHIRHNNKEGDKANAAAQAMSNRELEECYDNTYRELLLLIELQKNLPFHRKVDGLREQLDGKKDRRDGGQK